MGNGRASLNLPSTRGGDSNRSVAVPQNDPREGMADRQVNKVMSRSSTASERRVPSRLASIGQSMIADQMGPGRSLDESIRGYFEPRFGTDFSQVRVHAGAEASRSAVALRAEAFTDGQHLVFGPGRYAPGSQTGQRLIAHELAHVAQRQQGLITDTRQLFLKAMAVRFQDEPTLDDISNSKKTLKFGDKGEAVIRIQTALAELGDYKPIQVDEKYDNPTRTAVTAFQSRKGLAGKVTAGEFEKLTFDELDKEFSAGYKVERDIISKQKIGKLLDRTQLLNAEEQTAANRAISTEVKAVGGGPLPKFVSNIKGKGTYEQRLKSLVESVILDEYNRMGKDKGKDHADPAKLYDWKQIEIIAKESQKATDAVFSKYYSGVAHPALTQGTNLFDGWDDKEAQLKAGGKAKEDERAKWRVKKIIEGQDVYPLDVEHGAVQSRKDEAAIVKRVKSALVNKYRKELIETDKGWPGYADPTTGKIFIQRFIGATPQKQRFDMWLYYYTFIHEYVHTLENAGHETYRQTKSEKKGNKVLREGATEYLSHIVWSSINFNPALRKTIEGPFHDSLKPFKIPQFVGYAEFANAERLAGIVGIRNFLSSYFLGKAELIGKP